MMIKFNLEMLLLN